METVLYQKKNATILRIGVVSCTKSFDILLKNHILESVKIFKHFNFETVILDHAYDGNYTEFNYLFYLTTISDIDPTNRTNVVSHIKKVSNNLSHPINHVFIIVDNCDNLEFDDDGDLVFSNDNENEWFCDFDKELNFIKEELFDLCKISSEMALIWRLISEEHSIVNLTDSQIETLSSILLKKSSKLSINDKKREIKSIIKKMDIEDKISESGYIETFDTISQYFKLSYQKIMVVHNYIDHVSAMASNLMNIDLKSIDLLFEEINTINYLKQESHQKLMTDSEMALKNKIIHQYAKNPNNVTLYKKILESVNTITTKHNLQKIQESLCSEIKRIDNLLVNSYQKELDKTTNLTKIITHLESIDNNTTLHELFKKIQSNPKIIHENIDKTDQWIIFVDKCIKLNIDKSLIVSLLEIIVVQKILFYNDITRTNSIKDISIIYPQCLNVFLLSNLNKSFIFNKLYMFLNYTMRYSGKNLGDYIKSVTQKDYDNLLYLEKKLLDLCINSNE